MGQFLLLEGHYRARGDRKAMPGQLYKKGDVVDTHIDLVGRFGKEKFQCLHAGAAAQVASPVPLPEAAAAPPSTGAVATEEVPTPAGTDVTAKFVVAVGLGLRVYQDKSAYSVYDPSVHTTLNDKPLRRAEVDPFLDNLTG